MVIRFCYQLPKLINQLVSLFREMYLKRTNYYLHGLALVGVRSVLGVDNKSGSPFNIQRSIHIENLSFDEVKNMFDQYHEESKQNIEPDVVKILFFNAKKKMHLYEENHTNEKRSF